MWHLCDSWLTCLRWPGPASPPPWPRSWPSCSPWPWPGSLPPACPSVMPAQLSAACSPSAGCTQDPVDGKAARKAVPGNDPLGPPQSDHQVPGWSLSCFRWCRALLASCQAPAGRTLHFPLALSYWHLCCCWTSSARNMFLDLASSSSACRPWRRPGL